MIYKFVSLLINSEEFYAFFNVFWINTSRSILESSFIIWQWKVFTSLFFGCFLLAQLDLRASSLLPLWNVYVFFSNRSCLTNMYIRYNSYIELRTNMYIWYNWYISWKIKDDASIVGDSEFRAEALVRQRIDASSLNFQLMYALLCYHSIEHYMPR